MADPSSLKGNNVRGKIFNGVAGLSAVVLTGALIVPGALASGTSSFTSYNCKGSSADGSTISTDLSSLAQGGTLSLSGDCGSPSSLLTISVPADVTLEGTEGSDNNFGTEIFGHLTETSSESTTIKSLQVDCNNGNFSGITLDGWQLTVENVTVDNCKNGIELDNPSNGNGNAVNDRIDDNFISLGSTGYGFYVNDNGNGVTDGHFEGNYVAGGAVSINMTNSAGWYINNNHTYAQTGAAINAYRMWGTHIEGNYIENWTGHGITGSIQAGSVGSVVSGNEVFEDDGGVVGSGDSVGTGILLTAPGSGTGYAVVTGNVVINTNKAAGSYGINGSGTGLVFVSAGNSVQGAANPDVATSGAVKTAGV